MDDVIKAAQESYQQKFCPLVDVTGFNDEYTKEEFKPSPRDRKIMDFISTTAHRVAEAVRNNVHAELLDEFVNELMDIAIGNEALRGCVTSNQIREVQTNFWAHTHKALSPTQEK